jgi:serine/threonine-protein kinase
MGLVTRGEVDFCREQQKQASDPNTRSLSDLLVEHSFLTNNQAKRLRQVLIDGKTRKIPGYELIKKVGKGAMAEVFQARQISLDRIVAIKILPRKMGDNRDFVERFYKEGKAAARLSHNNIVQAIDVGESPDGVHYFVMEFVEGKTLYDLMAAPPLGEGKSFSEAEVLEVGSQMADALAHAHQRGLIHRDVKPKNIILTPQGVAKLTDLGLARQVDDKQAAEMEAGKAYGTPYYISPEQIRGDVDIAFRADIDSLGATLYHLATGRPPFEGDTPSAVMHQHLKQPLVPADHINTALSAGVGEIIDVAMAKRREDRYQSTEQMLEDLRLVAKNEAPKYARRAVDLESLAKIEETGKTVDLVPSSGPVPEGSWRSPSAMALAWAAGAELFLIVILVILLILLHK